MAPRVAEIINGACSCVLINDAQYQMNLNCNHITVILFIALYYYCYCIHTCSVQMKLLGCLMRRNEAIFTVTMIKKIMLSFTCASLYFFMPLCFLLFIFYLQAITCVQLPISTRMIKETSYVFAIIPSLSSKDAIALIRTIYAMLAQ